MKVLDVEKIKLGILKLGILYLAFSCEVALFPPIFYLFIELTFTP